VASHPGETIVADVLCPVVVGREAELAALEECLSTAISGRGGCVFVTGEAGIGKSRLARELTTLAESRGAAVVVGRAVPSGASVPYRPLTQALFQAMRVLEVRDEAGLRPWLPALGAIVPGFAAEPRETESPDPPVIRGEAVVQFLERLAPAGGLVIFLEDLHWADPDTIAIVEYLADNAASMPVLCVVTIRSELPTAALTLARRERGRAGMTHLTLGRLGPAQIAVMVEACVPGAAADLLARVQGEAEGVPLLVEDVLASPGVPRSFADTVRERLADFSPHERLVIDAAAVLGRDFDWELLTAMTGQAADAVSAGLARGVDRLLLSADGTSIRFRHALTREAVLEQLLPPRHRDLAAAALAALNAAGQPHADSRRDLAADLAERAGDRARAGVLLTSSGQASLRRGALATAVGTLRRAADLLEGDGRQDGVELVLVEALALAGRVDEAATVGARLIGRLGHDPGTVTTRIEVHLRLAQAAVAASLWTMARHQVDSACGLAGTGAPPAMAARVALLEAEIAFAADDPGQARRLAAGTLDGPEISPDVRCHALEIIGRSERATDLAAGRVGFE
jgi:predicted ATPase